MNGKAIIAIVLVVLIAVGGTVYFLTSDDSPSKSGKNTATVNVTVSNMGISTVPVKIYIDGELVQDTQIGAMGYIGVNKKVSWSGGDTHTVKVKVVYGKDQVQNRSVMVTKGQSQIVQINI